MINTNIDISDARYNTNAPFTYGSTLTVNNVGVPPEYFVSIRIKCPENTVFPVSITEISVVTDAYDFTFSDAAGTVLGTTRIFQVNVPGTEFRSSFIYTEDGILAGHLVYRPELGQTLSALFNSARTSVRLSSDAFVLLPPCCVPSMSGCMRCMELHTDAGVTTTRGDVNIVPWTLMYDESPASVYGIGVNNRYNAVMHVNSICFVDVMTDDTESEQQPVRRDTAFIGGKHLNIAHSVTSNIRVSMDGNKIILSGVKDGKQRS